MTSDRLVGLKQIPRVTVWFIGLVADYFAAQTLLRVFTASSLSLDEAEMLVVTQGFAWGYGGSQPPLYGWLMLIAFKIFGTGIPALAIVKNLLLFTAFVVMFQAGRIVLGDDWKAAITSAALVTIPQIGWKAQFDLTHSVLALVMAALTFLVFLRLLRSGRAIDYLAFGLCLALGAISKYNYAIFAVALLAGAALVPALRPRIASPWMLLTFGAALIVLIPHLHWIWSHPAGAFARVNKLGLATERDVFSAVGLALLAFARTFGGCVVLATALFAAIAWLPPRQAAAAASESGWREGKQLVLRVLGVSFVLALVLIVGSRSTTLRDHWFMPLVLLLPMGLFILWERRFTMERMRMLGLASAGLAAAAFSALAFMHFFPDVGGHRTRAAAPFGRIAKEIQAAGFNGGYLLSDTHYVGGNLKLRFPDSPAASVEYGFPDPLRAPKPALIVWSGGSRLPDRLRRMWQDFCADADTDLPVKQVAAGYEYSRARYSLNVVIQPRCTPRAE
jgi:4-amino-4-deoxy-L-arabinose transferase-like glycosyltransferase